MLTQLLLFQGDNQHRVSGQALEFNIIRRFKEKSNSRMKDTVMDKYGNAAAEEELHRELLLVQNEAF